MKYQAILFDLDDTLYDLRSYWTGRLRQAFAAVGEHYPQLDQEVMLRTALANKVYMQQMPDFLRRMHVDDEQLIDAVSARYRLNWYDELELAEDALAMLAQLRPHVPLGLVTNGPASSQRPKIERFGLAKHMDVLIISGEVGVAKPDPGIFHIALEKLGTSPAQTLYVGDSIENDLYGAAAAGMPFVWINRRGEPFPAEVPPPVAQIAQLSELLPLVEMQVI